MESCRVRAGDWFGAGLTRLLTPAQEILDLRYEIPLLKHLSHGLRQCPIPICPVMSGGDLTGNPVSEEHLLPGDR